MTLELVTLPWDRRGDIAARHSPLLPYYRQLW